MARMVGGTSMGQTMTHARAILLCALMTLVVLGLLMLVTGVGGDEGRFCHACFTGGYRVPFREDDSPQLPLFDDATVHGPSHL